MNQAAEGDTVKIHFFLSLQNGDMVDTSENRKPLEIELGRGNVIQSLEEGIYGMEVGDTKKFEIPPEQAFGIRKDELMIQVLKSELPSDIKVFKGQKLQIEKTNESPVDVVVAEITDDAVTLDANHPYAGQTLVCDIQLIDIF
jgi:FKBP-type peptidyl-prolyl cis-trans isomerase 2